jgi:hypothetical protein
VPACSPGTARGPLPSNPHATPPEPGPRRRRVLRSTGRNARRASGAPLTRARSAACSFRGAGCRRNPQTMRSLQPRATPATRRIAQVRLGLRAATAHADIRIAGRSAKTRSHGGAAGLDGGVGRRLPFAERREGGAGPRREPGSADTGRADTGGVAATSAASARKTRGRTGATSPPVPGDPA